MRKTHSSTLAAKTCVGEALSAAQTSSSESSVNTRKGSQLRIGVEILIRAQMATLRLAVRRKATLVIGRRDGRPSGAKAPELWRHQVNILPV